MALSISIHSIVLLLIIIFSIRFIFRWFHLIHYLFSYIRIQYLARKFNRTHSNAVEFFERRVSQSPTALALICDSHSYTFSALNAEANRVGQWCLMRRVPVGCVVGLLMENRPEYLFVWLGLAKAGISIALLNTGIRGNSLLRAIETSGCSMIICGTECFASLFEIHSSLQGRIRIFTLSSQSDSEFVPPTESITNSHFGSADSNSSIVSLDNELNCLISLPSPSDADFVSHRRSVVSSSILFYIFTSGTSGLPKASKFSNLRFYYSGLSFAQFFGVKKSDRIYSPLPLFHASAGVAAISLSWHTGCAIVLRRKFSASAFFRECAEYRATVILYIGQICRFLLNSPASEFDSNHEIRMAIGNGLSVDVWERFQSRFNIRTISEFYASTEGNANLVNNRNRVGAIGYIPWIASLIYPIKIVKFDPIEELPIRSTNGRLVECDAGEVGELIGRIDTRDPLREFAGYSNEADTNQKILRDAFNVGDSFFRSGDLVRKDAVGYIYYVDRIGDTFRWKGENVSTIEVADLIFRFDDKTNSAKFVDVNCYGIPIPGCDGKVGMISVAISSPLAAFQFQQFYRFVCSELSTAQRPAFIRFDSQLALTQTFKHRKVELVADGFDPHRISAPLFYRNDADREYSKLDFVAFKRILNGEIRF